MLATADPGAKTGVLKAHCQTLCLDNLGRRLLAAPPRSIASLHAIFLIQWPVRMKEIQRINPHPQHHQPNAHPVTLRIERAVKMDNKLSG